ncbi:alpha/beta hydrolase family protein [Pelosinus baikalensis]|uniref:Prolyl oligopeptidase family serine peptidase n=1 Tax=Pelosinus baikalensis TaxID=2892015 RepID=A0ABS8HYH3_9FIRM|nr:prolyl oligopeptidase family serine peptidase [Pelosinus baikalensis]MCC5468180.1 prolyl oligopeptidase family serine peptidase [Pelosinus baikalensis]
MKKNIRISMIVIVLLFCGTALFILKQNSFNMVEQSVEIPSPEGKLTGTLVLPENYSGKLGLVLFIHGDGPLDASHNDGYKPLWERLASLGYASLSLNKRGINGSEGNWLDQSMDDRVEESRQAITWVKKQPMIDEKQIGVWGASQAGWVIPKLAEKEPLAFSIVVSPAINWLTQGKYHTRKTMEINRYSEEETKNNEAYDRQVQQLLESHASYEKYLKISHGNSLISKDRWTFVSKNFLSDATDDLRHFNSPVLLLLGEEDRHVNVKETEQVYRNTIKSSLLTVAVFPNTEHSMLSTQTADSELQALLISLFAPRQITVPDYMNEIEEFLKKL